MSSSADQIPMDVSAIYLDNTTIRVSFTLPTGIVNPYYYYHVVAYDSFGNVYDTSGTTSPIVLYGLNEGTSYSYYVETIQTASTSVISLKTTQWPKIYVFYATDISYNAAMFNWSGADFSNVLISRETFDVSYISMTNDAISGKYYDIYDSCGNTLYNYYITPYLTLNGILNAGTRVKTTIITKVAPITNLNATPTTDGSAIIISFDSAKNSYNTIYYTAKTTNIADFSGTGTVLLLQNLSGNTVYDTYVTVTLDNSSALVAYSNTVSATTAVQAPSASVAFFDNSAILVNLYSKNTYDTVSYSVAAGTSTKSGESSPLLLQNLSGNTVYNILVSNTLNGNVNLSASNYLPGTITTKIQPPTNVTLFYVDSSAIAISYTAGANSYNTILWTGKAIDGLMRTITSTSTDPILSTIYITELSGNTTYTANVSVTFDGNTYLSATSVSSVTATTNVRPPYNLSLPFYDSSSILISFSSAPNTYTNSIYYIASVSVSGGGSSVGVGASASPIQISELSGNTTYNISVTTIIDGSLSAISDTIENKTYVQSPENSTIEFYDNSGVSILFGKLPRNSYSSSLYYIASATDSCGNVTSALTDGSVFPSRVVINGLSGNTTYNISVATIADNSYSNIVNIGTVRTGIKMPYNFEATEIYTDDPNAASIIDFSFIVPSQNGNIYYIATVTSDNAVVSEIDVSSNSSPILITGLSGNTDYSIRVKTVIDNIEYVSPTVTHVTTAIQTPRDVEIVYLEDASFTIAFTKGRNSASTDAYYILRATNTSDSSYHIDISSNTGILSMYGVDSGLVSDEMYSIDILTVVDSSMISYGELFEVRA